MNTSEFYEIVKSCKYAGVQYHSLVDKHCKVTTSPDKTIKCLYKVSRVEHQVGEVIEIRSGVRVTFAEPTNLTIFEHSLLHATLLLGKRGCDYAKYHECVAGKRFINNIKSIQAIPIQTQVISND